MISVITVHLNDQARLMATAQSLIEQESTPYEWIIKDGGSRVRSNPPAMNLPPHHWIELRDRGVYDAMNQALPSARGELVHFLNCGDRYWSKSTLGLVWKEWERAGRPDMIYGDIFDESEGAVVVYPTSLSDFYLFRRTVCQQAIFYRRVFLARAGGFCGRYLVCGDNEFLVRAVFSGSARITKIDTTIVRYGAAGISASREGRRRGAIEAKEIRRRYFSLPKRLVWTLAIAVTLPRARASLVERLRGTRIALVYRKIANLLNA